MPAKIMAETKATMKEYTMSEVEAHNTREDAWIVVNDKVFDVTSFQKIHPGGKQPLIEYAGKDATEVFYSLHRSEILDKYMEKLCVGTLKDAVNETPDKKLISDIPFAELSHWHGFNSPYYTEDHRKFQKAARTWMQKNLKARLESDETRGKFPKRDLYKVSGASGITALKCGLISKIPGAKCLGWAGNKLDMFHEALLHQEASRLNAPGATDCLWGGNSIGIPPLVIGRNPKHLTEIVRPVLMGKQNICLCVTEPYVGSDVAGLRTTAVKTEDGKHYIVNGLKKWITGGMMADWFTTAVRTGGPGARGVSCLVIPRSAGVKTTKIKVSTYSPAAGTAYVEYDNVKCPVEYLVGKENQGFRVIMANFNHERWMIAVQTIGASRMCIEECLKWANQRMVFGKALIKQPVIRYKLGCMIAKVEATQCFADSVTYQMNTMNHKEQFKYLGGPTALLKVQSTQTAEFVTSEACQIFGGRALTHGGMGTVIQRCRSQVKNSTIYGGSEEIMADLGVRQIMKSMSQDSKL